MERKARYRAAKIAAGDHSDQAKNTKARQKKRAANKAAGDHSTKTGNPALGLSPCYITNRGHLISATETRQLRGKFA